MSTTAHQTLDSFFIEKTFPSFPALPISKYITPENRKAPRNHLGHPYFSKLPWNVVSGYIEYYTQAGDLVLDPFCGSGVVPMEALVHRRRVVALDTNPLACFITRAKITSPVDLAALDAAFHEVDRRVGKAIRAAFDGPKAEEWVKQQLDGLPIPRGKIPRRWRSEGLNTIAQLFTGRQLLALALLRQAIDDLSDTTIRQCFRLLLSYTICRSNRMYILPKRKAAERDGRGFSYWEGDSTPFYNKNYQIRDCHELNTWVDFSNRYRALRKCKEDVNDRLDGFPDPGTFNCYCRPAQEIGEVVGKQSAAYALLDPPYGARIPALDLSAMWIAWLGLSLPSKCREKEVLDDPRHGYPHARYLSELEASVAATAACLRPKGWCTLVFAHDSPDLWSEVIDIFTRCGLEYKNSVYQASSLKPFSKTTRGNRKFAGLMMVNFRKEGASATRVAFDKVPTLTFESFLLAESSSVIAAYLGATTSEIATHLRSRVLSQELAQATSSLKVEQLLSEPELERWLSRNFERGEYSPGGQLRCWFLQTSREYDLQIEPRDRVRYYVFEALRSGRLEYDQICASVLLKLGPDPTPGGTPEIKECLEGIAYCDDGVWQLSSHRLTQYRLLIGSPYTLAQVRDIYRRERLPLESPLSLGTGLQVLESRFRKSGEKQEAGVFYRTLEILTGTVKDMVMAFPIKRIDVVGHFAEGSPPYDEVDLLAVIEGQVDSSYRLQKAIAERVTADVFLNHNVVITTRVVSAQAFVEATERDPELSGQSGPDRITIFGSKML